MLWMAAHWRKVALGGALMAVLASYALTYRAGQNAVAAACDARIRGAEVAALQASAQAVKEQRARADALAVANETLQGIADDLLAQDRGACPLDDDTRGRLLRIRP